MMVIVVAVWSPSCSGIIFIRFGAIATKTTAILCMVNSDIYRNLHDFYGRFQSILESVILKKKSCCLLLDESSDQRQKRAGRIITFIINSLPQKAKLTQQNKEA
jgi:hypothetical protein